MRIPSDVFFKISKGDVVIIVKNVEEHGKVNNAY